MNKRCTNSSCRKMFSTLQFGNICPHCYKTYPQLKAATSNGANVSLRFVSISQCVKIKAIKALRNLINGEDNMPSMDLREAKEIVEGTRILERVPRRLAEKIDREMKKLGAYIMILGDRSRSQRNRGK